MEPYILSFIFWEIGLPFVVFYNIIYFVSRFFNKRNLEIYFIISFLISFLLSFLVAAFPLSSEFGYDIFLIDFITMILPGMNLFDVLILFLLPILDLIYLKIMKNKNSKYLKNTFMILLIYLIIRLVYIWIVLFSYFI